MSNKPLAIQKFNPLTERVVVDAGEVRKHPRPDTCRDMGAEDICGWALHRRKVCIDYPLLYTLRFGTLGRHQYTISSHEIISLTLKPIPINGPPVPVGQNTPQYGPSQVGWGSG